MERKISWSILYLELKGWDDVEKEEKGEVVASMSMELFKMRRAGYL